MRSRNHQGGDVNDSNDRIAVITGAASVFGKAFAEMGAAVAMKLVLADIQAETLDATVTEPRARGASVIGLRTDVLQAMQIRALADAALAKFGTVHLLFNNADVLAGDLVWGNSEKEWVLGVDVRSVIHRVRIFTPLTLAAAAADYECKGISSTPRRWQASSTCRRLARTTCPNMPRHLSAKRSIAIAD